MATRAKSKDAPVLGAKDGPIEVGAHVSSSGGIFTAIERARGIEAEAIQIFVSAPQTWRPTNHTPEALAKFRDSHTSSGIGQVWIHNIYLANLATETPEQLEKSVGSVINALTVADAIGARGVVLHTGSHKGLGLAQYLDQVSAAIALILERSPGDALLALETMAGQGGAIGKDLSDLGTLLAKVNSPRLQTCLDTCHTFAAGYELRTPEGIDATMRAYDGEIGLDHLAVIHANDSKAGLGSHLDRHENIGDGQIGADGFRAMLAHPAFQGKAFLLEVPGMPTEAHPKGDGPDLENVTRLKKLRDEANS